MSTQEFSMFEIDPKTLSDSRIQLHWATQLLAAAADARLEKATDDSHSNLGWDANENKLINRAGCAIDVVGFKLEYQGESINLIGKTLAESAQWLSENMGAEIGFRDYEMPPHGVANGDAFSPNPEHLREIADWFTFGQKALAGNGELRVWPHHLDLGFWLPGDVEGRSIGGGFSPGDNHYDQPYFYINPYGIDQPDSFPDVAPGLWTQYWLGAVLTSDVLESVEDANSVAAEFVGSAISHCQQLIAA